jgi:hypothetical protein
MRVPSVCGSSAEPTCSPGAGSRGVSFGPLFGTSPIRSGRGTGQPRRRGEGSDQERDAVGGADSFVHAGLLQQRVDAGGDVREAPLWGGGVTACHTSCACEGENSRAKAWLRPESRGH